MSEESADGYNIMSEDCLYMDIWVSSAGPVNKPVLFFVYGGGLETYLKILLQSLILIAPKVSNEDPSITLPTMGCTSLNARTSSSFLSICHDGSGPDTSFVHGTDSRQLSV